jgi:hypothetical protein
MTTDYKTNPDYIAARRRGIRFGLSALFSFWYLFAVFAVLVNVLGLYTLYFVMASPFIGIAFAIVCLYFSIKNRNIALQIRYPDTSGVKPGSETSFENGYDSPLPK